MNFVSESILQVVQWECTAMNVTVTATALAVFPATDVSDCAYAQAHLDHSAITVSCFLLSLRAVLW